MKKLLLLLIIPAMALLASCKRTTTVEPDTAKTMNDLIVPSDFEWKTTQTLDIEVTLPSTGEIQPLLITNRDGSVKYFRGYPDDGSRVVRTKITIPSYIIDLRFIYSGTTGPNIVYIGGSSVSYNFNSALKSGGHDDDDDDDCDLSGYITYSKGGWGQKASGNNVGALRDEHFDDVYPGDFVVGTGYTLTFNASSDVQHFLPDGGGPEQLTQSYVNPEGKGHDRLGNNMADQIVAARLNRDFSAAGFLGTNTAGVPLGELVFIGGPFANVTVNDFLTQAEIALGGGDMQGLSASEWESAAESIIDSFHEGEDEEVLTCPTNPELDDPYIQVSSACLSNEVVFTITNTGDGDMTSEFDYTVSKNNVEIASGTYELDVNENLELTYSGLVTDEYTMVVETPRGEDLEETITGCGDPEPPITPPTEQYTGTLAYEDLWPGKGDYDFNDLVIDYSFDISKDNDENVESIEATFEIRAYGASQHNGFAFTLPNVEPSDIASVSGFNIAGSSVFNIAGNGVESGQSKATFIVFDDVRRVMPQTTGGIGVNTQEDYDYIQPVSMTLNITFVNEAISFNDLDIGTFNPFIIVNSVVNGSPGERGREIHLPNYEPSDLMDDSYFNTLEDASQPASGKYFVTDNNLPWAINIAEDFDWAIEFQDITGAYLHFGEWAESGGDNYDDWYKNFSGYRNSSLIYTVPSVK